MSSKPASENKPLIESVPSEGYKKMHRKMEKAARRFERCLRRLLPWTTGGRLRVSKENARAVHDAREGLSQQLAHHMNEYPEHFGESWNVDVVCASVMQFLAEGAQANEISMEDFALAAADAYAHALLRTVWEPSTRLNNVADIEHQLLHNPSADPMDVN